MPANRSRTLEWRRCLSQIRDRGGAIEIAVAGSDHGGDLVWRVRVLEFDDTELVVDQPATLGRAIMFESGVELTAFLTIGQNRWAFKTTCIGPAPQAIAPRSAGTANEGTAMRLRMPQSSGAVQRCIRRKHDRLNTSHLNLPRVEVWPLLDPRSTVLVERALELHSGQSIGENDRVSTDELMPDVGPRFVATLMNIGGGGLGLLVEPGDAQVISRHSMIWLRIALPGLATPICAAGKVVHSHIESTQQTYAGIAFDFTFNHAHQRVVVDLICHYIAMQQRDQTRRSA